MSEGRQSVEGQVVRALGSIGVATLVSRILGFARDMVVARFFGAGPMTDAFFVAYRVPNMLRRLLAEGALSTAVVPVFTDYSMTRTRTEFLGMVRAVFSAALVVLTVTSLLGILAAPWILRVIAPGFTADPHQAAVAVLLTRVMFPYLLLVGLAALAMGALNAHGRFFASAIGSAVANVGMIAGTLLLARHLDPPILSLAIGVLAGGLGQLLVQVPSLGATGLLVPPSAELRHPALGRVAHLLLPSAFGLAAVQITVFVNTLLASLLPSGSISFLYYADRIMEFPLGVFGIALASAALPAMSRQAAVKDLRGLADTLNFALRLSSYVAVPSMIGLVVLRVPITRVLFQRGQFTAADTAATADALLWYAVGLAAFSASRIAAQAFYAIGEPGTAVRAGVLSVVANVVAAVLLMRPMAHGGLAFASSIAAAVNLAVLVWSARRRFGRIGLRKIIASHVRIGLAAVPLALWCIVALWLAPFGTGRLAEAAWLAATILVAAAVYWCASAALGMAERTALVATLARRRSG